MRRNRRARAREASNSSSGTQGKTGKGDFAALCWRECYNREEIAIAAKKALSEGVEDTEVYDYLSSVLTDLGRFDEAEKYCRMGLARYPTYWKFYNTMGLIRRRTHMPKAAISYYDKAIRYGEKAGDKQTSALVYNNKGAALCDLKKYENGMECFDIAVKINLDCNKAWLNKYLTLIDLSREDEARAVLDELVERGKNLSELQDEYDEHLELKKSSRGRRSGAHIRGAKS